MSTPPPASASLPARLSGPVVRARRQYGHPGVWHFDSGVPGKRVMLSALIHGNELCGAWALRTRWPPPRRGSLTLAFCNLAA